GSTSEEYGSSSPACVRSRKRVTPVLTSSCTSCGALSEPRAHGWRPAMRRPGSMTVGGRTGEVCTGVRYPVRGERLIRSRAGADSPGMAHLETPTQLREHALALAAELGVDQ